MLRQLRSPLQRVLTGRLAQVVELPSIFSGVLFDRLDAAGTGRVTREQFNAFWQERLAGEDTAGRAFEVLRRPGIGHITHADVKPLMRELLVRAVCNSPHACAH